MANTEHDIDVLVKWLGRRANAAASLQAATHARVQNDRIDHTLKTDAFATALADAEKNMKAVDAELGWPASKVESFWSVAFTVAQIGRLRRTGAPEHEVLPYLRQLPAARDAITEALLADAAAVENAMSPCLPKKS